MVDEKDPKRLQEQGQHVTGQVFSRFFTDIFSAFREWAKRLTYKMLAPKNTTISLGLPNTRMDDPASTTSAAEDKQSSHAVPSKATETPKDWRSTPPVAPTAVASKAASRDTATASKAALHEQTRKL